MYLMNPSQMGYHSMTAVFFKTTLFLLRRLGRTICSAHEKILIWLGACQAFVQAYVSLIRRCLL